MKNSGFSPQCPYLERGQNALGFKDSAIIVEKGRANILQLYCSEWTIFGGGLR
jgi:hypothetical protein